MRTIVPVRRFLALVLAAASCASRADEAPTNRIRAEATSRIIADVVRAVGGSKLDATVPLGTVEGLPAEVVFANGIGPETPLRTPPGGARVVRLSEGCSLRRAGQEIDPHVWLDPLNVLTCVRSIDQALVELRPQWSPVFRENARRYEGELWALDRWIKQQVEKVPSFRRKMVSDEAGFGYFADRYGFSFARWHPADVVSQAAEPAPPQTVFTDEGRPREPRAGVSFVALQITMPAESGTEGAPATYLDMMRRNAEAVADALK